MSAVSAPIDPTSTRASRRRVPQRRAARDQVDAGGHHRRGVDQRRDRRRAFHRVGEPGVQRDLRRLRGAADEDAEHTANSQGRLEKLPDAARTTSAYADRADLRDDDEDREHDPDVADDVDDERFARRGDRGRALEVEADQEITTRARRRPQPTSKPTKLSESTSVSIAKTKKFMYAKKRANARSPSM